MSRIFLAAAAVSALLLSSCGLKGPLYMPPPPEAGAETQQVPAEPLPQQQSQQQQLSLQEQPLPQQQSLQNNLPGSPSSGASAAAAASVEQSGSAAGTADGQAAKN